MCRVLFVFVQRREDVYFVKGALEKVLQQCTKYASNGVYHPLNMKKEQDYLAEAYEIGRKGLRGEPRNMCHTHYVSYNTHVISSVTVQVVQCSQYQSMPLVIILRQFIHLPSSHFQNIHMNSSLFVSQHKYIHNVVLQCITIGACAYWWVWVW